MPSLLTEDKKLSKGNLEALAAWWNWLDDNRGARATLRRAAIADDVLMQGAFHDFLRFAVFDDDKRIMLSDSWRSPANSYQAAMVCGLLARVKSLSSVTFRQEVFDKETKGIVKKDQLLTFAKQLAMPKGNGPVMSELRFKRLQQSHTPEEFYTNMSRAADLLGGAVELKSFVESIVRWYEEFQYGIDKQPQKRLMVRWATDYYTVLNQTAKSA